jgi:hypothetical protein
VGTKEAIGAEFLHIFSVNGRVDGKSNFSRQSRSRGSQSGGPNGRDALAPVAIRVPSGERAKESQAGRQSRRVSRGGR